MCDLAVVRLAVGTCILKSEFEISCVSAVECHSICGEAELLAGSEGIRADSVSSAVPRTCSLGNQESLLAVESSSAACHEGSAASGLPAVVCALEGMCEVVAVLIGLDLLDFQ